MRSEKEVQYIWHDGVRIREDQLVSMAMSAGSYALAEHYVCALLAHGCAHGLAQMVNKANEIREYYQVRKYPVPTMDEDSSCPSTKYRCSVEDQIRKKYRLMSMAEREELLRACLGALHANYPKLFRFKNQWQGIYFVVHDRLDASLTQCDFLGMAKNATPTDWPARIAISGNEFKNLRRDSQIEDDDEMYYEMDYNPHRALCDTFWKVIKDWICGKNVED